MDVHNRGRGRWPRWRAVLAGAAALAAVVCGAAPAATADAPETAPRVAPSQNTSFVEREGSTLTLDDEPFRFNGANIYWLGLDENVPPGVVDYPTGFRIRDALDTAADLGLTVVRSHMLASTGTELAILPDAGGELNAEAFASMDYAIAYAGSLGIRLILPLTDEWAYYHGGHRDFGEPYGLCAPTGPLTPCAEFYSDPRVVADFQAYVEAMLDHVNPYTGLALKDDPTILAWELGNELEGMTPEWIAAVAGTIAEGAPEQLVAAGKRFGIDPDTLAEPLVDIVDVHYYPPTAAGIEADAARVAAADKVYVAGEYASTAASPALFDPLVDNRQVTGMMLWSLFGHDDVSGFIPHEDGFTLHYPGDDEGMRANVRAVQEFSRALGHTADATVTRPPLITRATSVHGLHELSWRGSAGAVGYHVDVRQDAGSWRRLTSAPVPTGTPWLDLVTRGPATYRVVPVAEDGTEGPGSDPVEARVGATLRVDPVESLRTLVAHESVRSRPTEDGAALAPLADNGGWAAWGVEGLSAASFFLRGDATQVPSVEARGADGVWWPVKGTLGRVEDGMTLTVDDLTDVTEIRLVWSAGSGVAVTRAALRGAETTSAVVDPLDSWGMPVDRVGPLSLDTGNAALFDGDASRAKRDADEPAAITWQIDGLSGFEAVAYYWPEAPAEHLTFSVSQDGQSWTPVEVETTGGPGTVGGSWGRYTSTAGGLTGDFVRAEWTAGAAPEWAQQLGEMRFTTSAGPELRAPGAFAATTPVDGAQAIRGVPSFGWEPSSQAAAYRFVLSTSADLSDPVHEAHVRGTAYAPPVVLEESTTYHWTVEAVNGVGETVMEGGPRSFTTDARPTQPLVVEDFETYGSDAELAAAYVPNSGGGVITPTLGDASGSGRSMTLTYDLGEPGYAGVSRSLPEPQSWWGYDELRMWLDRSAVGEGQTVTVQLVSAGQYWEAILPERGPREPGVVTIPFDDLAPPPWAGGGGALDLGAVTQVSFYLGGAGTGALAVDDLRASRTAVLDPTLSVGSLLVQKGRPLDVHLAGWEPGAAVEITLERPVWTRGKGVRGGWTTETVPVGSVTVGIDGAATASLGVSRSAGLGVQALVATSGDLRVEQGVVVVPPLPPRPPWWPFPWYG
ncbi:carbohydrate binding domain-containing protein [Cellulomonas sp. NPDC057328]|uniref:carbohydrate binding domain-containing protein n=1 Tax=Cellulomonas sp. NPDC057328 TaxID=3346101 RepID=UPI0036421995